jgi:16S rRNA (guanine527-N7)-methyltransferase
LRESFDVVTARAVAPLPTLLELTIPFLTVGGTLVAVKGQRAQEEIDASKRALRVLSAKIREVKETASGTIVLVGKTAETQAKYPRRSGEPKKNPL